MPLFLPQVEPNRTGSLNSWDIPFNDWVGLKFGIGQDDTVGNAVSRWSEDFFDDSPTMKPEVANRVFGIPGQLNFTQPVQVQRAMRMKDRKEKELEYESFLNAASHDSLSWKAAAGTAAMMLGGVSHPLDAGLMFVPFVGEEIKGAGIARLGAKPVYGPGLLGNVGDLGGVFRKFPNLTASVINGTLGNAVAEIPVGLQKWKDQANYGMEDAITNVLLGGATAGALHVGAKSIGVLFSHAAKFLEKLDPATQNEILTRNIADELHGRDSTGHEAVLWSEEEIARQIRAANVFNEDAARKRAVQETTPLGINRPEVESTILRDLPQESLDAERKAATAEVDRLESKYDAGTLTGPEREQLAIAQDRYSSLELEHFRRERSKVDSRDLFNSLINEPNDARAKILLGILQDRGDFNGKALSDVVLKSPDEAEAFRGKLERIRKLMESSPVVTNDAVVAERAKRISDYVEREKARHNMEVEGKIKEEVASRIKAQETQGFPMPEKEKAKWISVDDVDAIESHIAQLEKDTADIEKQIVNMASPEERESVQAELNKIKETAGLEDESASITAAINCVARGVKE